MRHIRVIEKLPISELSDEEIAKAAVHRLKANLVGLVYQDEEGYSVFIGRYRNSAGRRFWKQLITAWEGKFAKLRRLDEREDESDG